MKQVIQHLGSGLTEVVDVPVPRVAPGHLLIRTSRTLISAGTERMLIDFGKANPIEKARQQPDKVRQVLEKVKTDGLLPTLDAVRNKLDQPLALGYCHVGTVVAVGAGVTGFAEGDRVASNGKHAEFANVAVNLCAHIPDEVSDDAAAFTVIGAIALQGIRLVQPTLGETIVVIGLGLIGQMAVQLLLANGCQVLGLDMDPSRVDLARRYGAAAQVVSGGVDPVAAALRLSRGRGVDGVVITASTKSNEPVHQAAQMCRQRGRIVLVGVTGLELSRDDFYKKELSFQVSCSYGPGRYDPDYEEKGRDYPFGHVRWTEQRNFEAVLDMMAARRIDVEPLISHRFSIERAPDAYTVVAGAEPSLGILLEYAPEERPATRIPVRAQASTAPGTPTSGAPRVAFLGAGNYATAVLIPAFKESGAALTTVVSGAGVSAVHAGRKFGFAHVGTDASAVLEDPANDAVVVATRHDSHARYVVRALAAGRHLFVEKPLCLTLDELSTIEQAYAEAAAAGRAPILAVGFNRRFSPHAVRAKQLLERLGGPKAFVMTVNAGAIPGDHWTQDAAVGGGRIIGEACHFVDLLRFLAAAPITEARAVAMDASVRDTVSLELRFADGSLGTVHYLANGSKAFPKERLEIFASGRVLQLDNFRTLRPFGWPGAKAQRLWRQDKGQRACAAAFLAAVRAGGPPPIPFGEIVEVSRAVIELAEQV